MSKTIYYYLLLFFVNNIVCTVITLNSLSFQHSFITPENEIIIVNYTSDGVQLQIFQKDEFNNYQ